MLVGGFFEPLMTPHAGIAVKASMSCDMGESCSAVKASRLDRATVRQAVKAEREREGPCENASVCGGNGKLGQGDEETLRRHHRRRPRPPQICLLWG